MVIITHIILPPLLQHLTNTILTTCVGVTRSHFGAIPTIVTATAVLGMLAINAGKNGVILIRFVDGNIIKDGVIN